MKKLLSITIAFILIFSCFAVTAFAGRFNIVIGSDFDPFSAEEPIGTFSENYEEFYINGVPHSRVNTNALNVELNYNLLVSDEHNSSYYAGGTIYIDFTEEQKQKVKEVKIEHNGACTIFSVTIDYNDGATLTATYLSNDFYDEYNDVINGNVDTYIVDFMYPSGNYVETTKEKLMGEPVTLTRNQLSDWGKFDSCDVVAKSDDGSISMVIGAVIMLDDDYYYLNFKETGTDENDVEWSGSIGALAGLPFYKVTDEELVKFFDDAMTDFYEDDYGILYDDSATESISIGFFVFVFAIIPFVILVFFLVKAIKGKGVYKKIYFTVVAVCLAELIVFATIAGIVIKTTAIDVNEILSSGKTIEEFAESVGVGKSTENVILLKEAVYCGDGDCKDGCTTGYFYRGKNVTEEDAMLELFGAKKTDAYDRTDIDTDVIYEASWSTNIIVETTDFKEGYIVEYEIIGVG